MKSFLRALLLTLLAVSVFTTCDSPMGMGKEIDFEPPVLTLDPKPPTPLYVRLGTVLTGTVTDNDVVDRVILMDSATRKLLFTATLLPDHRWEIALEFSPAQNGETILADIVAFDRAGNSGAESIASVVLVIDIRPPIVEDIWIQRSSVKTADLDQLVNLRDLERSDPNGEQNANVNRYQNGAFNVKAKLAENETKIESLRLKFYDSEYPDIELLSLQPESGSSPFSPQWYVTENMILDAGNSLLPEANYKGEYKNNDKRYYYRLRVSAIDKSGNESGVVLDDEGGVLIIEDQGYFCLWQKADEPKGILDPLVVGAGTDIVSVKGSSLPVEFFDDDKIEWAFAALFTKEQWLGINKMADDFALTAVDEAQKFEALKNRLLSGQAVYNWRYDSSRNKSGPKNEPVANLLSNPADEKVHYLITGNEPSDFGEFVVVTLVKDQKQSPHDASEFPNIIKYRKYNVNLVDENAPLIVFDKPGGSPEENTFPKLDSNGNFRIFGYTLREDKDRQGLNQVEKFRIAWIPFAIATESNISLVRSALGLLKAALDDSDFPAGVQWWDVSEDVKNRPGYDEEMKDGDYRRQNFEKTFNILGGNDDLKPEKYKNFYYGGELENATKLFIFFAEDNMGHQVYSQFYLLGNRTPPTIEIYDITDRLTSIEAPDVFEFSTTGDITPAYIAKRTAFNAEHYNDLKGVSYGLDASDEAETYRAYPRGTNIKFWVKAKTNGDLELADIKMEDITNKVDEGKGEKYPELGFYKNSDYSLGYVEYFPEVTQRVFLFTATDTLGNPAKVQRTIAIANAATLTSVTTAEQNGTYPSGKTIELRANFDGMIKLETDDPATKPKLNVLYQINSDYKAESIPCDDVDNTNGQLYLNFKFKVPVNAQGRLETFYVGIPNNPGSIDRPITVDPKNKIIDFVRGDSAYTPGNVTGFIWKDAANSLQYDSGKNPNGKNINLDGIVPTITGISFKELKDPYSTTPPYLYYLKSGESLSIELTASKPLKVSGNASLQFRLQRPTASGGGFTGYDTAHFEYSKVNGNSIIFTLEVNKANILNEDHGKLENVSLFNGGNITDGPGNPVDITTFNNRLNSLFNDDSRQIYFDLFLPPKPVTILFGTTSTNTSEQQIPVGNTDGTILFKDNPQLQISNPDAAVEPYSVEKREYSLDGGLNWITFPNVQVPWTTAGAGYNTVSISSGQWDLRTRFIDKAGNIGPETKQLIHVNSEFPKLLAVKALQPGATYIAGQKLEFTLDFDDVVTVPATGVTITLNDRTSADNIPGGLTPSYSNMLTASPGTSRTVTFTWNLTANTYDMPNGLMIYALNITGLKDKFGNSAPAASADPTATSVTVGTTTVAYNTLAGVKVSTIKPAVRSREPQNAQGRTGNITVYTADPELVTSTTVAAGSISADNKTIKLNFNKAMQKGNGTITIRPHGNYAIPAVFENDGYYITVDLSTGAETRSSSAVSGSTYVSGFYDIFNSVNNADKNTLIGGTLMSAPAVSQVTGLSVGPYLKTTHGLTQGAGYTGNYGNPNTQSGATIALPGNNAPGPRGTDRMIPDTETKWVLAYQYDDLFSAATTGTLATVTNIRAVLDRAKWRWQEIAVTNNNVNVSGKTVTIALSEPLLPGLQWDISYPDGTFTDEAGNPAAGEIRGNYWFWSRGVQKPVIRVDRKSYDARAGDKDYNRSIYGTNTATYQYYVANGYNGNITSFNEIKYSITSETPQARIFYVTQEGKNFTQGGVSIGSITASWTDRVNADGVSIPSTTNNQYITWDGPKVNANPNDQQTIGTWVRPNLIFRNYGGANDSDNGPYIIMEEGIDITKKVTGSNAGQANWQNGNNNRRYYGFRSYNKDAAFSELNSLSVPIAPVPAAGTIAHSFTYDSNYEASKNYVVAQARIDYKNVQSNGTHNYTSANYESQKGFEGVFRTVVMINQNDLTNTKGYNTNTQDTRQIADNNLPMSIAGTNVRSGLPTVSGFPIKDGVLVNDSRFIKVFYRDAKKFIWVTSEIVCQCYYQINGRGDGGGSTSGMGDVDDWLGGGYGDLSYALNVYAW